MRERGGEQKNDFVCKIGRALLEKGSMTPPTRLRDKKKNDSLGPEASEKIKMLSGNVSTGFFCRNHV